MAAIRRMTASFGILKNHPFSSHFSAAGVGVALAGLSLVLLYSGLVVFGADRDGDSFVQINGDKSLEFALRHDGRALSAKWRGDFDLAADARSLERLDGRIEIDTVVDGGEKQRLVIKGDGAPNDVSFTVDGEEMAAGDARDAAIGDLLQAAVRASGVKAADRVNAILAAGGFAAVRAEIKAIETDNARRRYIEASAAHDDLAAEDIATLADEIARLDSDYDRRAALSALAGHRALNADAAARLVTAAQAIDSDYEKRRIIEAFAARKRTDVRTPDGEGDGVVDAFPEADLITLFDGVDSGYELRLAAEALFENDVLSDQAFATALKRLERVESSYDKRLAAISAAGYAASEARLTPLLSLVRVIDDERDRRLALEAAATNIPATDEARAAFRRAAASIDDVEERKRALEALNGLE